MWGKKEKKVAPVNVAEKEEVDITGTRTQPVVMSLQCVCDHVRFFCACVYRGENHMGLSHVLFTAANGSRHWGPLAFRPGPLGDG